MVENFNLNHLRRITRDIKTLVSLGQFLLQYIQHAQRRANKSNAAAHAKSVEYIIILLLRYSHITLPVMYVYDVTSLCLIRFLFVKTCFLKIFDAQWIVVSASLLQYTKTSRNRKSS